MLVGNGQNLWQNIVANLSSTVGKIKPNCFMLADQFLKLLDRLHLNQILHKNTPL